MDEAVFPWVVVGSAGLDLAVALASLFARPGPPGSPRPGLGRVGLAAVLTSAFFLTKAGVLARLGVGLFGLICLAYVDLVAVVPALGLAVLGTGRATRAVRLLAVLSLGGAAVGWYATFHEPFNLRVEAASLAVSPARAGRDPVRIGVLTDLQTRRVTDYERGAVDRLLATRPDVILVAGDIFQGDDAAFERERPALRDLLGRLDAPGGVYYVQGDVDRGPGRADRIVEGTKMVLLFNESRRVVVGDRTLTIGGVELAYASPSARRLVEELEAAPGDDDIRVVLAHRPDVVSGLRASSRVDLVVAGHTHGGQVVVPGFGPILTLSDVPRRVAAGGLHRLDGNAIYVGRGVGCERAQAPRVRFFCPPEVAVVTLGAVP